MTVSSLFWFLAEEVGAVFHYVDDNVASADDAGDSAFVENGDAAEVIINQGVADLKEGIIEIEADDVPCHIVLDEAGPGIRVAEEFEEVFFRDDTNELHRIINDGQSRDISVCD